MISILKNIDNISFVMYVVFRSVVFQYDKSRQMLQTSPPNVATMRAKCSRTGALTTGGKKLTQSSDREACLEGDGRDREAYLVLKCCEL